LAQVRLAGSSDRPPPQVVPKDRLFPPPLSAPNAAPQRNYQTSPLITLTWSRITWARGYEVQIAKDTLFTSIVYDNNGISANTLSLNVSLPNGIYFWHVRAKKPDGQWGGWSVYDTFQIAAP